MPAREDAQDPVTPAEAVAAIPPRDEASSVHVQLVVLAASAGDGTMNASERNAMVASPPIRPCCLVAAAILIADLDVIVLRPLVAQVRYWRFVLFVAFSDEAFGIRKTCTQVSP